MTENKIRKNYDKLYPIYEALGLTVGGEVGWLAWLAKAEKRLHRMAENACNYALSAAGETRQENIADSIREDIEAALPKLRGLVKVNRDPRGWSIKIDPYVNCSRGGLDADPNIVQLMQDAGIARDWGGYGLLSPDAQYLE